MAVTINANGLSIVHKGSGGEANATLPDVCLTTVGPAVVPIPYGNNAKSADLADGTTTVSADGGNSIAIKGSKFAKSTGDAGGDKKGVSSGTIEAEAEFISASGDVIIEGQGVARLTDQMTMNKANTMCLGGVQNPSVSVDPVLDIPNDIEIKTRYPNGQLMVNAPYAITDENNGPLGAGTLDNDGQSCVDGLNPGKIKICVEESNDTFCPCPVRRPNPHHNADLLPDDFFDLATKGQQGFWKPTRIETSFTPWGSIGQELSCDQYFQDIVSTETRLHFTHLHPDTTYTMEKVCDAIVGNLNMPLPHTTETLVAYCLPMILEEGELLSVLLRLAPHETTDRMLAYMRARGQGNPQRYLQEYDWSAAKKTTSEDIDALLKKIQSRLEFLRDEASKLQYAYLSEEVFDKHINTMATYIKGLPELMSGVFTKMQLRATNLLSNTANVKVIKASENVYSAEAGVIEAVVNTAQTVDVVEPYMNEVPGKIANVLPIYPVRYGYANFMEEAIPAQAPPLLCDMVGTSSVQETGGYLLRLLREGWIYIKEEGERKQFHIFKYCQVDTATGVLEKFEKYYFTNEENAQEGLTLDTSSGATFYPFAFVTANTTEISIAYSEHEWSPEVIDKMNEDEALRQKSMQRVDLTSTSSDFSLEATEDNFNTLVEDYRSNDEKWLAIDSDTPQKQGLDIATTKNSYHLSSEGIVETMQKSHSEKKNGTLIALYDPVGRQADLACALTLMTGYQKVGDPETLYPRTIGKIVKGFLDHPDADIQKMAKENIEEAALNAFFKESEAEELEYKKRREALLEVYAAFAYQDMADGSIGSLDNYLKMFFDIESNALKEPEKEVEKLTRIAASIFDGTGASEEGQAALIAMINDAYERGGATKDSQSAYYIITQSMQSILLQCQAQVDWKTVIELMPIALSKVWAQARATSIYGAKLMVKSSYKLSATALSQIVDSFLPTFFEKVFGIVYTGEKVRVTHDKLAELIAKHIDSGGKSMGAANRTKMYMKGAKKLFNWGEVQKRSKIPIHFELSEIKVVREVQYSGRFQTTKATTILDYIGMTGDGVISGFSWFANIGVMNDVLAQSDFSEADPLERSGAIYSTSKLISALAAFITDSAAVSRTALVLVNRGLSAQLLAGVAHKMLPKTNAGVDQFERLLKGRVFSRIIAVSNVAMVFVAIGDGYDDWKSGNTGSLAGNISIGLGSAIFAYGAVYYAITGVAIALTWGIAAFVLIVAGGVLSWIYGKGAFENLLFRCFWGKSDDYSFWYFTKSNKSDIEKRLKLAKLTVDDPLYQKALEIEVQEFMNFLMQPSVSISNTGDFFSKKETRTYKFVLPNFVWKVSELAGSIQKTKLDMLQSIQNIKEVSTLDESETKVFTKALEAALSDTANLDFKNGALHLSVEVELDEDSELHWCYQPTPDVVVPKRMLTSDGKIKKTYIGMRNDEPMGDL
ncbi:PAAR-like domain-containing protein [Vibrio coralliilyticus]|uniref:DUF4150 domain-containing protein n=1 Tax=Vibrio coralliilyticus TaxID=190893 RepID=A0AAP7DDP1_9VIBR|nr:PAAR-like domain-containing protein [Vibrio coralliilyticus]NOJ24218.1 DUF4150 domain-containing protein [Vibrio coralliilyticus]